MDNGSLRSVDAAEPEQVQQEQRDCGPASAIKGVLQRVEVWPSILVEHDRRAVERHALSTGCLASAMAISPLPVDPRRRRSHLAERRDGSAT